MDNTLVAVKPKMKQADPGSRTGWNEGLATPTKDDSRDANPMPGRLIARRNTFIAQFAYLLFHGMAGYVGSPVTAATVCNGCRLRINQQSTAL